MTGAQYIVRFLCQKGIHTIFGYPGATVLGLYDAIAAEPQITHVLTRHEQGAVFAASGYAKASGIPGVCIATSGPGAVNLTTGIAEAYLDSVPLLIFTGQVETGSIGRDAFQEADIMGITIPVTKHNYLIKTAEALPRCLEEAWRICTQGRRGPVLIDIARDILDGEIEVPQTIDAVLPRKRSNDYVLSSQLGALRRAIAGSFRPLILAGGGVSADGASTLLATFAAESGIPIVTTLMGMGIRIDRATERGLCRPPHLLGMAGRYGNHAANEALSQCDLLLAIGTRFSDRTIPDFAAFSRSRTIIHCDIDPAEISKNVQADIGITCSATVFLEALLSMQRESALSASSKTWDAWNAQLHAAFSRPTYEHVGKLKVGEVMQEIDTLEEELQDAVYVSDVGDFQMTAARVIEPRFERGFLTSGGLGAMGFGLPAAIGTSFSASSQIRQIIAFCGDGGLQMSIAELATLHAAKRPIKIFLFNNHALRMIEQMQDQRYERRIASSLEDNPDFEMIGAAYGLPVVRLDQNSRETLSDTIRQILRCDQSMLVHCLV